MDDGTAIKVPWYVTVDSYEEKNGLVLPSYVSATWENPEGDYSYFKGKIAGVSFND